MTKFTDELNKGTQAIRDELAARYGLTEAQADALPTVEGLAKLAQVSIVEIGENLFDSLMTATYDRFGQTPLDATQASQFSLLSKLADFSLQRIFAEHDPFADSNPAKAAAKRAERKLNLLATYEGICREIIDNRAKKPRDQSQLAAYLLLWFPMPPDRPSSGRAAATRTRPDPRGPAA